MTGEVRQDSRVGGRDNIVIQVAGDRNTVVIGLAYLTLTRYLTRRRAVSSEAETELLNPYTLSLGMVGRERELAALRSWLADERPISVRVLTGAGGRGKTRLTLGLVEEAFGRDWDVAFVTSGELRRFRGQQNAVPGADTRRSREQATLLRVGVIAVPSVRPTTVTQVAFWLHLSKALVEYDALRRIVEELITKAVAERGASISQNTGTIDPKDKMVQVAGSGSATSTG